jgi:hypothetical protein
MSEYSSTGTPTFRNAISSAFYFVRSFEENKATYGLTLDHMIEGQIQMLGDPDAAKTNRDRTIVDAKGAMGRRLSRYDRLGSMLEFVKASVKMVKDVGDDEVALKKLGLYEVDAASTVDLRFEDPAKAYEDPLADPFDPGTV